MEPWETRLREIVRHCEVTRDSHIRVRVADLSAALTALGEARGERDAAITAAVRLHGCAWLELASRAATPAPSVAEADPVAQAIRLIGSLAPATAESLNVLDALEALERHRLAGTALARAAEWKLIG